MHILLRLSVNVLWILISDIFVNLKVHYSKALKKVLFLSHFLFLKKFEPKKKPLLSVKAFFQLRPFHKGFEPTYSIFWNCHSSFILDWCACLFFLDIGTNDHASIFTVYSYAIFKFGSKEMTCYSEKLFQITKIIKCVLYRRQIIFCKKKNPVILFF